MDLSEPDTLRYGRSLSRVFAGRNLNMAGADGRDGADGKDGRDGADGRDGKDGRDGIDGTNGKDGDDVDAMGAISSLSNQLNDVSGETNVRLRVPFYSFSNEPVIPVPAGFPGHVYIDIPDGSGTGLIVRSEYPIGTPTPPFRRMILRFNRTPVPCESRYVTIRVPNAIWTYAKNNGLKMVLANNTAAPSASPVFGSDWTQQELLFGCYPDPPSLSLDWICGLLCVDCGGRWLCVATNEGFA